MTTCDAPSAATTAPCLNSTHATPHPFDFLPVSCPAVVDDEHEFFAQRGHAYMLLKDYKTAISNFKRALKLQYSDECKSSSPFVGPPLPWIHPC